MLSNPSCATLNADNARFPTVTSNWGWKIEGSPNGTYSITNADGELTGGAPSTPGKSVTISNSNGIYFDWSSTLGIDAVIVKGGPNSDAYVYDPEDLADSKLHPPVNPNNGQYYGISHIEFCFDGGDTRRRRPTPTSRSRRRRTPLGGARREGHYTFTVTNNGPAAAHDVVVGDVLPEGLTFVSADPRCDYAAGKLECSLGTLAAGQTVSLEAILQVAPATDPGTTTAHDHQWDVQKVEAFQSLQGGQTGEWSLSCPSGYAMVDGSARTDSVDQGTGAITDVETLTSKSSPADDGTYLFKAHNGTSGQAQMHLFGVCVAERSTSTDGHTHGIQLSAPVTGTDSFGPGRNTTTLSCPAGTYAVAPGFRWVSGSGSQYRSESSADGSSWSFGFDQAAAGQVETSVRCLDERTTTDAGHSQLLELRHVHAYPTVAPGDMGSSQPYSDQRVSCGDAEKGIVATYDLPPGVTEHGNTPEPKIRDFRILNATGQSQQVHLDLLCLGIRSSSDGGGGETSVTNTACVDGAENDTDHGNDCSSFVLAVSPGTTDPVDPVDPVEPDARRRPPTTALPTSRRTRCSSGSSARATPPARTPRHCARRSRASGSSSERRASRSAPARPRR